MSKIFRAAHTVLFPAFDGMTLSDTVKRYLDNGGYSILIGESRAEYVARKMTDQRIASETAEDFHRIVKEAKSHSNNLLVAVDQEIGGICRLHQLVPQFPPVSALENYDTKAFEELSFSIGEAAKGLGVNLFLAPILDLVTGQNPWLSGRTWSTNPKEVARISSAYIRGIQRAGVAATAKHFPGFHDIPLDPAINADAIVRGNYPVEGLLPFQDAILHQVEMIMVGPAIVEGIDDTIPATLSPTIINKLKNELHFKGIVMSDDLDAKATLRGRTVEAAAVEALNAGADFLLLAAFGNQLETVVSTIVNAVENNTLSGERLLEAAEKVEHVASKYA